MGNLNLVAGARIGRQIAPPSERVQKRAAILFLSVFSAYVFRRVMSDAAIDESRK